VHVQELSLLLFDFFKDGLAAPDLLLGGGDPLAKIVGDLLADFLAFGRAERGSQSVRVERLGLRRLEYDLLAHLASEPRRVFHKRELLINLWGYPDPNTTRTLDSHASRLRRKLSGDGDGDGERWIINVYNVGYRLI
jgi:DNA-binding response OmpR family regulator